MFRKIIIGSLIVATAACSRVPAGHRGVIVNLYGGGKGVAEESVGVGMYWMGWSKELYLFPTFLQNYTWTQDQAITMQTKEGLSIKTEAGITYVIPPENIVRVFQKYRLGIEEITNTFLHNMVRDAMNEVASRMSVEEIYGSKKEDFINAVSQIVKSEARENGIEIDKIYLIGSFELPGAVVASINSKIQATQNALKVENEIQTAKAEAQKKIVNAEATAQQIIIHAESQAKANRILAQSLTPEFVEYQKILKWDGKLPQMTGNQIPLIKVGT